MDVHSVECGMVDGLRHVGEFMGAETSHDAGVMACRCSVIPGV